MPINTMLLIGLSSSLLACIMAFTLVLYHFRAKRLLMVHQKTKKITSWRLRSFRYLTQVPLLKRYVLRMYERFAIITDEDETALKSRVVSLLLPMMVVLGGMVLVLITSTLSLYERVVCLLVAFFLLETFVDYLVNQIKVALLKEQLAFNEMLRSKYLESMMIDEALHVTIRDLDQGLYANIIRQGARIYDVLTDIKPTVALEGYYQVAPNKYLKLLAGLIMILMEHGDCQVDQGSLFVQSLGHLNGEIREEILIKERLNFALKSLNVIVIVPVFAMKGIHHWAVSHFYPMKKFYASQLGFSAEVLVMISVLVSFWMIRRLQEMNEERLKVNPLDEVLGNIYKRFKPLLHKFIPITESEKRTRVEKRLRQAMRFTSVENHMTSKVLVACLLSFLVCGMILIGGHIEKKYILTTPTAIEGYMGGDLGGALLEEANMRTLQDNQLMRLLDEDMSNSQQVAIAMEAFQLTKPNARVMVARVQEKQTRIRQSGLSPLKVVGVYLCFWCGWSIPDLFLHVRRRMILVDVRQEVGKFQSIVMMLMHMDHMTVDLVLEWLERFSEVFKWPIQRAIMDYDAGAMKALTVLKDMTEDEDLSKIVDSLIASTDQLSLREAFDELDAERLYYQERKKAASEKMVQAKINWGQMIGFVPTYTLLLVYFMLPLVYASVKEMQYYFERLSQMM